MSEVVGRGAGSGSAALQDYTRSPLFKDCVRSIPSRGKDGIKRHLCQASLPRSEVYTTSPSFTTPVSSTSISSFVHSIPASAAYTTAGQ